MNPEKEIVLWWLGRKGYFCTSDIKAGNRNIDILAVKNEKGQVQEAVHVEVAVSVSSSEPAVEDYRDKFFSRMVTKAVSETLKHMIGSQIETGRMLVTTAQNAGKLENIKVVSFSEVIGEVLGKLGTQNYSEPVLRALQLVKYCGFSHASSLKNIIADTSSNKAMQIKERESFVRELLSDTNVMRALGRTQNEDLVLEILKHSSLNSAERLAKVIDQEVLGARSRKRFLNALLELEGVQDDLKQELSKDQKRLGTFFNQ